MDQRSPLKARLLKALNLAATALPVVLGLCLIYLATQRIALDIHIREPGKEISVQLTVADRNSTSVYSFNLPPLSKDAWHAVQQDLS